MSWTAQGGLRGRACGDVFVSGGQLVGDALAVGGQLFSFAGHIGGRGAVVEVVVAVPGQDRTQQPDRFVRGGGQPVPDPDPVADQLINVTRRPAVARRAVIPMTVSLPTDSGDSRHALRDKKRDTTTWGYVTGE